MTKVMLKGTKVNFFILLFLSVLKIETLNSQFDEIFGPTKSCLRPTLV